MALASRGSRDMDGRVERVDDDAKRERLRAKGRGVRMRALIAASFLTIATLFLR